MIGTLEAIAINMHLHTSALLEPSNIYLTRLLHQTSTYFIMDICKWWHSGVKVAWKKLIVIASIWPL